MLAKYGMLDQTHIAGFATGDAKNLLLQGSDLFALTSHSENFGISVLEALAAGLPVLVTPGVALAAIVEKNQLGYVPDLDVTSISRSLEKFLTSQENSADPHERDCIRQFILENYTWDQIAKNLIQVYLNILDPP